MSDTPLIAGPGWIPDEPAELRSLRLTLDEQPHAIAIDGCEAETLPTRPLCAAGQWFDSCTSAIRHLDPPRLFESRPSYRLLGEQLGTGILYLGLTRPWLLNASPLADANGLRSLTRPDPCDITNRVPAIAL